MTEKKLISFHVDVDSPLILLNYWGGNKLDIAPEVLDKFYKIGMERALSFFKKHNVQATFFCVGNELEKSQSAQIMIKKAHGSGHEIADHSYSHTFGLTKLSQKDLCSEITKGYNILKDITGTFPAGFRSPGYDVNTEIINTLEMIGYKYDSSGFWSSLNPLFKFMHKFSTKGSDIHSGYGDSSHRLPGYPYYPAKDNWQTPSVKRDILEIPMPSSGLFRMPFYSTFHLKMPEFYRHLSIERFNAPFFVYLFHLRDFVSLEDDLPQALKRHPNIALSSDVKIKILDSILEKMLSCYDCIRTDLYVEQTKANE